MYYVNWNYLMDPEEVDGTLEEAIEIADDGAAYTQQYIVITDEGGEPIAVRRWYGYGYDPDETEDTPDEIIDYGRFGYFGAWDYDVL